MNTNKNVKNAKDVKNVKEVYTPASPKLQKIKYAEYVSMTNDEHDKLIATYGQESTAKMIETLDNYKGANGKKYASDYRAILNWVVEKVGAKTKTEDKQDRVKEIGIWL